jgi:glucosamine-6-phosphate deaminase
MLTATISNEQRSEKMTTKSTAQYLKQTKIPTLVFHTPEELAKHVAQIIEGMVRDNNAAGRPTILGLPTGSSPIGVYRELIRMHRDEGLDLSRVITFNLDEYYSLDPKSVHSYNRWMRETFFNHVNIAPENIHIPRGDIALEDVENFCEDYEQAIQKAGGLDLQLLGIGRTGHIGFNEPGSTRNSRTRMVTLDPVTRRDAANDFFGEENVPVAAITMGVGTILSARKIIIIAQGEHKASIIQRSVEGEVSEQITASFLQNHPNAIMAIDAAASQDLTAVKTPWLVGKVDWTDEMVKRAMIWLSNTVKKPLLKLEAKDFIEHHLHSLLQKKGTPRDLRQTIFDDLLSGICTQPGGPTPQKIIVFSPHPDDDVISMGGTLITLADQGHEVYIAYMTSGNIAVFDHDAIRHADYVQQFLEIFKLNTAATDELFKQMNHDMSHKKTGDSDSKAWQDVKGLIRKTEAIAGAKCAGVPGERLRFLDLPFYRTGQVAKKPVTNEDSDIIAQMMLEIGPGQIYVAGDLSDPHGTHRMCAQAILGALPKVAEQGLNPDVWLYRGAWQEYEPHQIDRSVPLSPEVMLQKKLAIFKHESQKDRALFPGHDEREFWVRAEQRTRNTARIYNELGLPEYVALESFKRYTGTL